jgi:hypothetical protein
MVTVKIFVEGAVMFNAINEKKVTSRANSFRRAFKKLLSKSIDESKFNVEVEPCGGYKNAITLFKANSNNRSFLLIDLDAEENKRNEQVIFYELNDFVDVSFFMVQKMESWFLSQTDKLEMYFSENYNKKTVDILSEDESIKDKIPQLFRHPDFVLKTIIAKNYLTTRNGKEVKLKYGKLEHAPDLIELLEINKLQNDFTDVANLIDKINQSQNN